MLPIARRCGLIREEAEILGPAQRGLGHEAQGLSRIPTLGQRDLFGARDDPVRDAVQDLLARGCLHIAPCRKSGFGGAGGGVDIGSRAARHLTDQAFIDGRVIVERPPVGGGTIPPADPVHHTCGGDPVQNGAELGKVRVERGSIGHRISLSQGEHRRPDGRGWSRSWATKRARYRAFPATARASGAP